MMGHESAGRHLHREELLPSGQAFRTLRRVPSWPMGEELGVDLNLLLALGALLEDRNLTRAGERLGMSQPAMSAALARPLRHFGDELLEREGRGYRRTVSGEQLLPRVREALRQLEATMQRSPRFDPADSDREVSSG